jgi:dihydroneopterin aldolase
MTQDCISLTGMKFHTCVGLLPFEEEVPQPLELDLTVWVDLRDTGATDSPEGMTDYRDLYAIVSETVGASHHKLLEALCEKVAKRAVALPRVERVRVAARKPHVPIPGPLDHVEVVVVREA